jgi:hypothetical protein
MYFIQCASESDLPRVSLHEAKSSESDPRVSMKRSLFIGETTRRKTTSSSSFSLVPVNRISGSYARCENN